MENSISDLACIRVIASGRVQGVWYRKFCFDRANKLNLEGWVKNMPDGSVQLVAQGSRDKLDILISKLNEGPPFSKVENLDVIWLPADNNLESFKILY
ncbi:MAG: acylphosphatase [Candidatus Neomarinimicrobiota bacterium]